MRKDCLFWWWLIGSQMGDWIHVLIVKGVFSCISPMKSMNVILLPILGLVSLRTYASLVFFSDMVITCCSCSCCYCDGLFTVNNIFESHAFIFLMFCIGFLNFLYNLHEPTLLIVNKYYWISKIKTHNLHV